MTVRPQERYFTSADIGALFEPGVVTSSICRRRVWYEEHAPVPAMRMALAVARRSWVRAAAIVPSGAAPAQAGLALAFAEHLHQLRSRHLPGACVTSPLAPTLPQAALCRIPHLVTVQGPDAAWQDAVVWEVMSPERFRQWFHRDPAGLEAIEARLPQLVALRRLARNGALPDSPAGRALAELLCTRYLSIRLVLEHPELFAALLSPKETHP
ncbi:hypothetical protein ACFV1N_25480 [Streptosporangium canum]|uniref:hypothetical protein n=1 Tax=Streptosporangium canum TaxID=324952 RepID=UPI0036ABA143